MIQVFSNSLGQEELAAIERVFESRWVGKGEKCEEFEREFGKHLRATNVLLTNNCTAAICLALKALNITAGDEVIISTINFVACASAIVDVGAIPLFADVHPETLNILPSEIERLTTPKTTAVLVLHYGGHPSPMSDIGAVCGKRIQIIEDSANAVSSSYMGTMCGTIGDAGVFSFDAMKILVTIDGGALVIKGQEAFGRAKALRYLGYASETTSGMEAMRKKGLRWWEYDLVATSGRFISNDVSAAIGLEQLKKLPHFLSRRKQIWGAYQKELSGIEAIRCPPEPLPGATTSYYLYWIQLPKGRDSLAAYLAENDVYTTFRYYPLHLVGYFKAQCRLPNAEEASRTTLNLPLHQNMTDKDVDKICSLVKSFVRKHLQT